MVEFIVDDDDDDDAGLKYEEPEEPAPRFTSVLDASRTFATARDVLDDDRRRGFDLLALIAEFQLDFHGAARLLNFARAHDGLDGLDAAIRAADWREDSAYLRPTLEDDALLLALDELIDGGDDDDDDFSGDADVGVQVAAGTAAILRALEHGDVSGLGPFADMLPGLQGPHDSPQKAQLHAIAQKAAALLQQHSPERRSSASSR